MNVLELIPPAAQLQYVLNLTESLARLGAEKKVYVAFPGPETGLTYPQVSKSLKDKKYHIEVAPSDDRDEYVPATGWFVSLP
jgi:hypothetical protein